ncbi:hypothetical protein J4E90_003750 [Alternaria incomplexa]|uniref:uncharacterized protein n=1 Tax=Alternaria incomplexa TaxID=1187928 RepID=UPI00221FB33A|nr:uncharacterized protein J4E90_003750 [Alternaria incomplexa]KAI4917243.1 hypothetical protein J4E90_003750 [Alternaria incomplexa]
MTSASSVRNASWYAPWSWGKSSGPVDASSLTPADRVPIAEFSHRPVSEFAQQHAQPVVTTSTPELAPAAIDKPAVVDGAVAPAKAAVDSAPTLTEPKTLDTLFDAEPVKDTLPTAEIDPTRLIDHSGQLQELGLDYGWGMTTLFEKCIETIYLQSGMGWAGSIIAAGVVVRCTTFVLQAASSDKMAVMSSLAPVTKPIQEKMEAALARGDKQQADLYKMQQAAIMKPYVGGMLATGGFMIAQAWIGFSAFRFLRAMADLPVPGMAHDGFLWFTDLSNRDPYFILPAATSAIMYTTGGETGVQPDTAQAVTRQKIFTGLSVFLGVATAFQASALQLYFLMTGIMGGLTGWLLRQNGFRKFIGIRPLPSKESNELYSKVVKGEAKLSQVKGADGRARYQPPTRKAAPMNRRQLSGINIKSGVALPAHLKTEVPKTIDTEYPDRDIDFEEGAKGKPISEKLDYYRRNYRLAYIWRRTGNGVDRFMRSMGFGDKKMSPEEARRKKRADDYEIERRRRFQNRQ